MTVYSKFNVVYRLQKWMDSVPGQTFLNYAYSWGASIVILGTLFKLTHLPGANFFLFLGMGTEVFVFFISAFDRPFDKTTDGMNLDIHPQEDNVDEEGAAVAGISSVLMKAICMGAVFFGAMTYIGNGPNFMVKSIAEQSGVKMPSFFGYMLRFSLIILLPVFIIVQLLFI